MSRLSDETLMLFADGQLDADEQERVGRLVAADPVLRAQADIFRATGTDLARIFDPHLREPIPSRLRAAIEDDKAGKIQAPASILRYVRKPSLRAPQGVPAAIAASLIFMIGLWSGLLLRGGDLGEGEGSPTFTATIERRLVATAPLKQLLETAASSSASVQIERAGDARFRAMMTFRNEAGDYCRQYEISRRAGDRFVGIACRNSGGVWSVAFQALMPPALSGETVPASAAQHAATDAAISALIAGDPIVGEAEAAIMGNAWRK